VHFPPAPSQYTSDQTTLHLPNSTAKRKANNVKMTMCLEQYWGGRDY
jgi:hypothetical protein